MTEKIKIAVDSCVVIMLAKLASENLNEKDKALIDCIKRNALTPDLYKDIPYKHLPPLLKDKYFGELYEDNDGKKYYSNLINMYRLLQRVEKGIVELYITPTVFGELDFEWFEEQLDFIEKYVNVIQIRDEDAQVFYAKRGNLAKQYVKRGAMLEEYSASLGKKVPQNDAYIMAEAGLCGLILVTVNNKDFINSNKWKEDYKRADIIGQVNKNFGLVFDSNIKNYKLEAQPMTLSSFILKSRLRKNQFTKPYYIVNPRIEDNAYKPDLSK